MLPSAAALLDRHVEQPVLHDLICLECGRFAGLLECRFEPVRQGERLELPTAIGPGLAKATFEQATD